MQPTTHEAVSEMKLTGYGNHARPGLTVALRARVIYGFLILALCLMIADFCRLTRTPAAEPFTASSSHQSTRF